MGDNNLVDVISFGTKIYRKYPSTQKILGLVYRIFYTKPTFVGWGMQTNSQAPWIDEYQGKEFRKAAKEIKEKFVFNEKLGIYPKNIDETLWRHWNLSFAINYALSFVKSDEFNLVECGVADGLSALFVLKEMESKSKNYSMHLYDSWDDMRKEVLLESELSSMGRYKNLNIEITRKNLQEFSSRLVWHQGYVPDTFDKQPKSPESIVYLHIDLNSAKATTSTLDFFFPKLVTGGVMIFDDYGSMGHPDTKLVVDQFFSDKAGILMKSPTGQAIYFKNI